MQIEDGVKVIYMKNILNEKRKNRFNFRKSILVKNGFDKNKSEHKIMLNRGIYRIYDCGCLCYIWKKI